MRFLRWPRFRRSLCRRLAASLTLLAYVATAFGVPLPGRADGGAACGCATDDECHRGRCCCAVPGKPRGCCTGGPDCTMPCCRHESPSPTCAQKPRPSDSDEPPAAGVRWVLGIAALKCQGHSTIWVSAGIVLPVPVPFADRPNLDPTGWLAHCNESPHLASIIPPDPPPRLAAI